MSNSHRLALLTLLAAGAATPCVAQPEPPAATDAPPAPAPQEPGPGESLGDDLQSGAAPAWRAQLRAWAWLMGVEGDVGVRGRITEVSASFGDIFEASDSLLAFSGRLEVGHGPFGAYFDGMYANVGAEDQTGTAGRAAVDIEFEQVIVDFGLMYRLVDVEPEAPGPSANARNTTLDLYAGGRYIGLDVEVDPDRVATRRADESWVDPLVGAKAVFPLAERWHVEVNGDVGGFGVASDLTWSATAVVGYDFEMFGSPASALLGYRIMGWDYTEGGENEFTWDLYQHGIILGLDIAF